MTDASKVATGSLDQSGSFDGAEHTSTGPSKSLTSKKIERSMLEGGPSGQQYPHSAPNYSQGGSDKELKVSNALKI